MPKYGQYSWGQIEAVLNKIGGEVVIDGLLQGTLRVETKTPSSFTPVEVKTAVCQAYCTICGAFFDEADDICAHGHEIGKSYQVQEIHR